MKGGVAVDDLFARPEFPATAGPSDLSPLLLPVDIASGHGAASIRNSIIGARRDFRELEAVPWELARD